MSPRMTTLQAVALLLCLCSVSSYLNHRITGWPPVLAMTLMGIVVALLLAAMGHMGWVDVDAARRLIERVDFAGLLLHGLLGVLLFAGALAVDWDGMWPWRGPILSLVTVGVLASALTVAVALWALAPWWGFALPWAWCLLFGALIAPTDPIGALAIVRGSGARAGVEAKMVGEALFNDGTGVVLFLVLLAALQSGQATSPMEWAQALVLGPVCAIGWGAVVGWGATQALRRIDHHPTEMLITLATACAVYGSAEAMAISAPIAAVVAGLTVGHGQRHGAVSAASAQHLDAFWEGIDEVLNAVLFVLIGLELLVVHVSASALAFGVIAWVAVLIGRAVGVWAALLPWRPVDRGTRRVLIWGGLRGGISLALALSLPPGPNAQLIVTLTFVVVAASSVVQGLSLRRLLVRPLEP